GVKEWLEVSSCSNGGALQAERAMIRFKRDPRGKVEHPHILNASGLALPRLMISVIENYQQEDGSLVIPKAVRPYMGGRERVEAGTGTFALAPGETRNFEPADLIASRGASPTPTAALSWTIAWRATESLSSAWYRQGSVSQIGRGRWGTAELGGAGFQLRND